MSVELSETQRSVLQALCDTFVPSIKVPDDPTGFWARTASDLGVDRELARRLSEDVPDELLSGLLGLLDGLVAQGFVKASQDQRESLLRQLSHSSPQAALGISFYEKQTLLLTYGIPGEPGRNPHLVTYGSPTGQNPNWQVLGYPGPVSVPPQKPKQIQTVVPSGDRLTLEADVCVVGSGAGGAVIAARMAIRGRRVVVLEMGGHYNSSDFHQLELWSYKHLWYKGGATPTANGTVTLLAGATLGGGTEINWMNCIRTPSLVRDDWARQYGLEGLNTAEFDRYMDLVEQRLSVGSETALFNGPNLRMREGCAQLGYLSRQTRINWDPKLFNALMAGYTGLGDQTGGKQTARRTYLLDAYQHGARIIVHCRADRLLVEQGQAVGVEATYADQQGRKAKVVVYAPQVVVACGALESPALLLRSGIGGQAVGKSLRVQPGGAVYGIYKERQKGWWGSPMTANCEQFTDTGDGFGFYMEIPAFAPGFYASVIPWATGKQHKEVMTKVPFISTFIWFLRDKGYGQVTIDDAGNAVPTYQLSDETDQKNFRQATAEAIRIHAAAGAQEILFSLAHGQISWKQGQGQSLENFIQSIIKQPLLNGAQPIISAHQLCTCRMGQDAATSVADINGELHDVKGVWIGDASACPTSLGANPMVTIMALAERTADKMAASLHQDFNPVSTMTGNMSREFDAVPRMAGNMLREMVGIITNPASMLREMIGIMTNPLNMFALGERLLLGQAGSGAIPRVHGASPHRQHEELPMYSHVIELAAKPGLAKDLVNAIRDQAIPQIIRHSEGFVDEIVLLSDTDPSHVTAISFWRCKQDGEHFYATGFAQVSALLQPFLSATPEHHEFVVGASTNNNIVGWRL